MFWILLSLLVLVAVGAPCLVLFVVPRLVQRATQTALRAAQEPTPSGAGYTAEDEPTPGPSAPASRDCGDCAYFDQPRGQSLMGANPAFLAMTRLQQPWQAGRVRNPDHIDKERELRAAREAGDDELAAKLAAELEGIKVYLKGDESDPETQRLMGLQWTDFGVCDKRHTLVAPIDTCADWTAVVPVSSLTRARARGSA